MEKIKILTADDHPVVREGIAAMLKKEKEFRKQALNLHEGLDYYVVFTVRELTGGNNVMGDLIGFSPVILSKLPN
jgi:hypothetical protein